MRCLLYLVIFFWIQICVAQQQEFRGNIFSDSLHHLSFKALLNEYILVSPHNAKPDNINIAHARILAESFITRALKEKDSFNIGRGYLMLGRLDPINIDYIEKSIAYTKSTINSEFPTLPYIHKFAYYYNQGEYRKANNALVLAQSHSIDSETDFSLKSNFNHLNISWGDTNQGIKDLRDQQDYIKSTSFEKTQEFLAWVDIREEYLSSNYYSIAEGFYRLNDFTSANLYLDSVQLYGTKYNFPETIDNYNGLKGAILYKQGEYQEALSYANAYLNNSIENDDYGISRSSVIKGLTLWGMGNKELAIVSLSKADSLYQQTQDEFEELGDGYKTLIAYYKELGDKDKQLEYLNKLLLFDEEITANYLEIAPAITRSYTIPELLSEKESVIEALNLSNEHINNKKTVYYILLMVASGLIGYFIIQRIIFKRRFDRIKKRLELSESPTSKKKRNKGTQELFDLDAKQIERIAKGLERFELEKGYINTRLSLKSLATSMDTNSSYLSKYINAIKGVNFSRYVNTLRIHAIVEVLQVNSKIRSYTIDAIAEEAGFSNTRSFSNHFKRVTGINPSYFLKKLQKDLNANGAPEPQTV
mgnify:CR=1 FL=1